MSDTIPERVADVTIPERVADGTDPRASAFVSFEDHTSALADATCRHEHAERVHAAALQELTAANKALDNDNAELRRQLGVAARALEAAAQHLLQRDRER